MNLRKQMKGFFLAVLALACSAGTALAYTSASKHIGKSPDWFRGEEARQYANNILAWQTPEGGWPKNTETTTAAPKAGEGDHHATFDNSAGFFEILYLAHFATATDDAAAKQAVIRALDYIMNAQYGNGGWPQSFPPSADKYNRYITFNDGTMARQMFLLRDVATSEFFSFVDSGRKLAARKSWDLGIECILNCQVRVNGELTVWGAQHDEITFEPRPARTFEPTALSGSESLAVMNLLMHVENPSPRVISAVDAAAAWFEKTKLTGIRIEDRPTPGTPKGFERFVVQDPAAPAAWARFYEIGTNRPLFLGRDGVTKYSLAEIDVERRTGYQWYGRWATIRLEKEYPAWKAKLAGATTQPAGKNE